MLPRMLNKGLANIYGASVYNVATQGVSIITTTSTTYVDVTSVVTLTNLAVNGDLLLLFCCYSLQADSGSRANAVITMNDFGTDVDIAESTRQSDINDGGLLQQLTVCTTYVPSHGTNGVPGAVSARLRVKRTAGSGNVIVRSPVNFILLPTRGL